MRQSSSQAARPGFIMGGERPSPKAKDSITRSAHESRPQRTSVAVSFGSTEAGYGRDGASSYPTKPMTDRPDFCTSCGAPFAPDAHFCGACGAARGVAADRSAWRGFRAQRVWVQAAAWLFLSLLMVMFWIWSGSGWHVAGKIAATVALLAAFSRSCSPKPLALPFRAQHSENACNG